MAEKKQKEKQKQKQKQEQKKPSIIQMLNPKNLATEVHRYGYDFSFSNYLKYLLIAFFTIAVIGYLFGLDLKFIVLILVVFLLLLPTIILTIYQNMYEQKKFTDVTNYIEQLLYSFKRRSKILTALEDTLTLFPEGGLHDGIVQAIEYIQTSTTDGNIYEEAFAFIEKEYGCPRVYTAHSFLIHVESLGGNFDDSIDILLADRKLWVDRVYNTQQEKKNIKSKITISVLLSFLICGMALIMLPAEFEIKSMMVSQVCTTIVFIVNLLIWVFAQKKLSGSWIAEEKNVPFSTLKRYYDRIMHKEEQKGQKQAMVFLGILVVGALVSYFVLHNTFLAILFGVFFIIMWITPKRKDKAALKHLTKEVEKAFPEWLLSIALLLQTDNLHVALAKTIDEAPEILQEELQRLLQGIEATPNLIDPYLSFFHQLDLPEIQSAMKMLYSMAEYGTTNDVSKQITALVERNAVLMDKAERIRTEDKLAGAGFIVLLPMLTGTCKMVVDMILLVFSLLTNVAI